MQSPIEEPSPPGSFPVRTPSVEVRANGPFAVGVVLWRDESARVLATVVAKATFALAQGTSSILDRPDPIRHPDEYWDDGASDSLRFPSDLAPFKAAHEVTVIGHVHANGSQPTHGATARVVVGDVDKVIAATSPRRVDRAGQMQIGPPQSRFSLRYELAAGTADNPVGIDPCVLSPMGGHALPQLVPPNVDVRPGDAVPLVGLGPVSRSWRLRDALLRPEDRAWVVEPLRRPRPRGFDLRYFNASPLDQRSSEPFRPDARIILEGLHPAHPRLVTNLPGVVPVLRARGAERSLPEFVPDTLFVDADRQIVTLAFRTILAVGDEDLILEVDVAGGSAPSSADETTELDRRAVANVGDQTAEIDRRIFAEAASRVRSDGALPFRASSPGLDLADASIAEPTPVPRPSSPVLPPATPTRETPVPAAASPLPPARVGPAVPALPPLVQPATSAPAFPPPPAAPRPIVPTAAPSPPESRVETGAAPKPVHPRDLFRSAFAARGQTPSTAESAPPRVAVPEPMPSTSGFGATTTGAGAVSPPSARAASDAAVVAEPRGTGRRDEPVRVTRRAIVDLVSFDAEVPLRLRRSPKHAPLLAVGGPPPRAHQQVDLAVPERSKEDLARRDVLRVLSCGTPLDAPELGAAFDELLDDPFDYDVPLLLVEGDVRPTMDEVETLRIAVELVKPLAGANKRVQAALALANEALARAITPLPENAVALYRQLEGATHELSLPPRHVAELVDRTLLASRSFKKRTLLGAPRIRADLVLGRVVLPLYLPEAVGAQLPLLPSFPLAALVELRPREDATESNPASLVAFALGRVLRARRGEHRG